MSPLFSWGFSEIWNETKIWLKRNIWTRLRIQLVGNETVSYSTCTCEHSRGFELGLQRTPWGFEFGVLKYYYKSSNLQSSQTHCLIPKSPQSAMFACEYFWIATKTRQGLDDVKSLNLPLQKCPQWPLYKAPANKSFSCSALWLLQSTN